MTSSHPDVTVVLSVSSATELDTGYYLCTTQPPDTISPQVLIQITGKVQLNTTILLQLFFVSAILFNVVTFIL